MNTEKRTNSIVIKTFKGTRCVIVALKYSSAGAESFIGKKLGLIAEVSGKRLKMSVYTDQPGVQFYIANFLGGKPDFKGGIERIKHGAFCLETQTEPNCINHGEGFYDAGEKYTHTTVYKIEKL